jgi:hypothetical protein
MVKTWINTFHLIIWFDFPPTFQVTPDFIDNIISAELLPEGTLLYDIIKCCNIHGPCGVQNPTSLCMQDGKCKKQFPKEFQQVTVIGEDSYPKYRQHSPTDGGRSFTKWI